MRFADALPSRPGLRIGEHQLPDIAVAPLTDVLAARANGESMRYVVEPKVLTEGKTNGPAPAAYQDRAMLWVVLDDRVCTDMKRLHQAISAEGVRLTLEPAAAGPYGMLLSCLYLPGYANGLGVVLALSHGNLQMFLDAAYRNETIEVHLSHERASSVLAYICRGEHLRQAIDATVSRILPLRHPATNEQERAAFAELRSGKTDQDHVMSVDLTVCGVAEPVLNVQVPARPA